MNADMPVASRRRHPAAGVARPQSVPSRRPGAEWSEAQADARARSSSLDPHRLIEGLLVVADGTVILATAGLASLLRYGPILPPTHNVIATGLALLMMLDATRRDGLDARRQYADSPTLAGTLPAQLVRVLRRWALTMMALLVAAYLTKTSDSYGRLWAAAWFALGMAGFSLVRLALMRRLRSWRRQGRLARMVAIVDLDGTGRVLARRLQTQAAGESAGEMRLLGVFAPAQAPGAPAAPRTATIDDLIALAQLFRIDDVLVTISWPGNPAMPGVLRRLSNMPTTVRLCPVLPPGLSAPRCQSELLLGNPTLVVCRRPLPGWHVVLKRAEDLLLGSLFIVLLSPVMLLVAAAVRVDSRGPSLFRQRRLGFNNNPITVYKFRSMTDRPQQDHGEVVQASRQDARVTRVGRFIRRTSLDELPQLFNVLRGEMSLVGPRPHAIAHNEQYSALIDDYLGRHRVQPGITGWAQVNGLRGETDTLDKMQKRVEFDLAYIERWSVVFDLRIIAQTAMGVLFHQTAY